MITFVLPDGRKLVLGWHTPAEWAEIARSQMLGIGCSEEYAERYADLVRRARRPQSLRPGIPGR